MTTAADVIRVEQGWEGRTENPANSNHIFIWTQLIKRGLAPASFQGQPYCAGGIVLADAIAKGPELPVQSPFYTPSRVQFARAHGLWDADGLYQPGDEVFFAWSDQAIRAGLAEHVERVVKDDGKIIVTIGCNTSSGLVGSQQNGDGVWERRREHGPTVLGALAYSRLLATPLPTYHRRRTNPYLAALRAATLPIHQGDHGDQVRGVQWAVGVPVDGDFGPETDHGVRTFQRFHQDRYGRSLRQDGQVGKLTFYPLVRITHWQH